MRALAIAAFFLGIGLAGEPLMPVHALVAAGVLVVVTLVLERRPTPVVVFAAAVLELMFVCFVQHDEVYPGTGVVAFGLAMLSLASLGRPYAPVVIGSLGALLGTGLFFLL